LFGGFRVISSNMASNVLQIRSRSLAESGNRH
jgi:hypothetical protein